MTRILKKIKNPQDEAILINQNFDNISLDLVDRSGVFSTAVVVNGTTISATSSNYIKIGVQDDRNLYTIDKLPIIPRINLYVDAFALTNRYPDGSAINGVLLHQTQLEIFTARSVQSPVAADDAQILIVIHNMDSSSHTYYATIDAFYVPAPDTGVANRV